MGRARRQRGPPLLDELAWGAHAAEPGTLAAPVPLFPRLEIDAPEARLPRPVRGMRLVDSHAHLQSPQFADDLAEVLAAAELGGVERLLVPGWDESSSRRAIELVASYPRLVAAAGIHPHAAAETDEAGWDRTAALALHPSVVAVGETGLDYDRLFSPAEDQLVNLRRNLALALTLGKPVILHCRSAAGRRDAQDALLAEMRAAGFGSAAARAAFGDRPPALLHSVCGPVDYVAAALELGCAVSISGLCFRKGEEATAESVRLVPAIGSSSRPTRRTSPPRVRRAAATSRPGSGLPRPGWRSSGVRTPKRSALSWSRTSTASSRRRAGRGARTPPSGRPRPAGPGPPATCQTRRRQRIVIAATSGVPGSTSAWSPVLRPSGGPVWGSTQTPLASSV